MKTLIPRVRAISTVLKKLKQSGTSYERIAFELGVTWHTVNAWATGRRNPKKSAIKQIEHLFGVKVL